MATAAVLWVVYDVYGVYVLRVVNIFPIRDAETREKSWIVTSWFGNKQHQVGYVGSFFLFCRGVLFSDFYFARSSEHREYSLF